MIFFRPDEKFEIEKMHHEFANKISDIQNRQQENLRYISQKERELSQIIQRNGHAVTTSSVDDAKERRLNRYR